MLAARRASKRSRNACASVDKDDATEATEEVAGVRGVGTSGVRRLVAIVAGVVAVAALLSAIFACAAAMWLSNATQSATIVRAMPPAPLPAGP